MKTKFLSLIFALATAMAGPGIGTSQVIYQTGFEGPEFVANQSLRGQDGWLGGWFLPGNAHPTAISTVNARDGAQCVRFFGGDAAENLPVGSAFALRPIFNLNDPNAPATPLIVEIRVDARLDGPQTGSLGIPSQDILSANLAAAVLLPNGFGRDLGGFFVSSAGRIWTYGSRPEDAYKYSVPYVFGTYRSLALRVDFVARTLSYRVDDVELGSAPIASSILSEKLISGYLWLAGPTNPIDTPELTYHRQNYSAYFDNYRIAAVPFSPTDVAIQFAVTDYAGGESAGAADVRIVRRGYLDSAVSATLQTSDASAITPRDYHPVSTVVSFAPGESEKVVRIPVQNDRAVEADEIVNLALIGTSPEVHVPRPSAPLWILDDERAGSVDPSFNFDSSALGVRVLYETPSIDLLPGGKFFAVVLGEDANANFVSALARFNPNGSVDPSFPPYPNAYKAISIEFGRRVLVNMADRLLILQSNHEEDPSFGAAAMFGTDTGFFDQTVVGKDGGILVTGFFDTINGVPRSGFARLLNSGDPDPGFNPVFDNFVSAIAVQGDGRILVGGGFQNVSGSPRAFLARLNTDGSVDPSFDPLDSIANAATGFAAVSAIAIQRDGRILVGGNFVTYQGARRVSLVRLLPNGALDPSFDTGIGFVSGFSGGPGTVTGIVPLQDRKIVVSGSFISYQGIHVTGIIRLMEDGTLDPAFRLGGNDSFHAEVNAYPAPTLLPTGELLAYIANNVSFIKNEPVNYRGIVRLNRSFIPLGSGPK